MLIIAISTLFRRLDKIGFDQFPISENIRYVISCQGEKEHGDDYYQSCLVKLFGQNVIWQEETQLGLSNNRNNALKLAQTHFTQSNGYVYICDDDVTLTLDGLLYALEIMQGKKLACLTGIVATKDGLFKNYQNAPYQHTKFTAAKVCSVEILVSLDFISDTRISFDSRFGLNAQYPSGEEFIFINDIIAAGGRASFYPIRLCVHPPVSSGDDFYSSDAKIKAKGAMLERVFSFPLNYLMIVAFAIKKYKMYRHSLSLVQFLGEMLKGAGEIKK